MSGNILISAGRRSFFYLPGIKIGKIINFSIAFPFVSFEVEPYLYVFVQKRFVNKVTLILNQLEFDVVDKNSCATGFLFLYDKLTFFKFITYLLYRRDVDYFSCDFECHFNLFFVNNYFFDFVTLTYFINNIKTFKHFSEPGMLSVEVFCISTTMADKEL